MTNHLLLATLTLTVVAFVVGGRQIISPFFVTSLMYTISLLVAWLNRDSWALDIGLDTASLILASIAALGLGEVTSRGIQAIEADEHAVRQPARLEVPRWAVVGLTALTASSLVVYALATYELSIAGGNSEGLAGALKYARLARISGLSIPEYAGHLFFMAQAVATVFGFILIHNKVLGCKSGVRDRQLVPAIVLFLVMSALTTGRTSLLHQIVAYAVIAVVVSAQSRGWRVWNAGMALKVAIGALVFATAFVGLGAVRQLGGEAGVSAEVSVYVGSSVAALDEYMRAAPSIGDRPWGSSTLYGINSFLDSVGVDVPVEAAPLEYTQIAPGVSTNVYTPLRRYMYDFGLLGTLLVMYGIGATYGWLFGRLRRTLSDIAVIVFALFYYPIVEIAIEERVFMDVTTAASVYIAIYTLIVYRLIYREALAQGSRPDAREYAIG